jgi:hypothetical protein
VLFFIQLIINSAAVNRNMNSLVPPTYIFKETMHTTKAVKKKGQPLDFVFQPKLQ